MIVIKIKDLPEHMRPREKAVFYGVELLSDSELLAIVLKSGTRNHPVLKIAETLLMHSRDLNGLARMNYSELVNVDGVSSQKAVEILCVFEIVKRSMKPSMNTPVSLHQPQQIQQWLQAYLGPLNQEVFMAMYLSVNFELCGYKVLFKGTLDQTLIHPREVFKHAVQMNAASIIVVHNHPGGSQHPSVMDCHVTERLVLAGELMGISLVDHLIVTLQGCVSLRETHSFLFQKSQ